MGWFKKKEKNEKTEVSISIEDSDDGIFNIQITCLPEDEECLANLIYLISSGHMLASMVESLKDTLGEKSPQYIKILQTITKLYADDLASKEENINLDEPLIIPSEVFMGNNKYE